MIYLKKYGLDTSRPAWNFLGDISVLSFIGTHHFDPQHPENFFVKRKTLAPVIREMRDTELAECRLATRGDGDRPELLFSLPLVSDELIEALARECPDLVNVFSPDYMHLAPQFTWGDKEAHVAIMAGNFCYSLVESERGGFGIAFFNQRVGYYSHGKLDVSAKEKLADEMDVCWSHSMNYRPSKVWEDEHLEKHRGLNDAPSDPNSFDLEVFHAEE